MIKINMFLFPQMSICETPTLCALTGMPGTGKSTVSEILKNRLGTEWKILHADDYINETFSKYGDEGKKWPQIRQNRPILIGVTVGPYLSQGKNILVEGNLKDENEIKNLFDATKKTFEDEFNFKVVLLRGDFEMIVKRCVSDRGEEPQYGGLDKEDNCRRYLKDVCTNESIADVIIDVDGKSKDKIAGEVLKHIVS